MIYIIDTHALVWFLAGDNRLGLEACRIMSSEEAKFIVPTIVIAEVKSLISRHKIKLSLDLVLEAIRNDRRITICSLDLGVVENMPSGFDIHDAIIIGTAILYKDSFTEAVKIITRDKDIAESGIIETIWK